MVVCRDRWILKKARSQANGWMVKSSSTGVDPLALRRRALYCLGVRNGDFWTANRLMTLVAVVTIAVTAITVLLLMHAYRGVLTEAFEERSAAYVTAFSASAHSWLAAGDEQMLNTAASFLLLGSVLYVQVISDGLLRVDDRVQAVEPLDLSVLSSTEIKRSLSWRKLDGGGEYLDLILPQISRGAQAGKSSGYVRMGIEAGSIGVRVYGMTLVAAGIGAGFDGVVFGLLFLLLRRLRRGSDTPSTLTPEQSERKLRVRRIGGLVIDEGSKHVSLDGKSVRLTPKQYALLSLLASDAGRVFSESEILQAVWAESDYADSKDVKQYVYLLRRRLSEISEDGGRLVVNVPGFGYKVEYPKDRGDLTAR